MDTKHLVEKVRDRARRMFPISTDVAAVLSAAANRLEQLDAELRAKAKEKA